MGVSCGGSRWALTPGVRHYTRAFAHLPPVNTGRHAHTPAQVRAAQSPRPTIVASSVCPALRPGGPEARPCVPLAVHARPLEESQTATATASPPVLPRVPVIPQQPLPVCPPPQPGLPPPAFPSARGPPRPPSLPSSLSHLTEASPCPRPHGTPTPTHRCTLLSFLCHTRCCAHTHWGAHSHVFSHADAHVLTHTLTHPLLHHPPANKTLSLGLRPHLALSSLP